MACEIAATTRALLNRRCRDLIQKRAIGGEEWFFCTNRHQPPSDEYSIHQRRIIKPTSTSPANRTQDAAEAAPKCNQQQETTRNTLPVNRFECFPSATIE
jgi:hypothetical protein